MHFKYDCNYLFTITLSFEPTPPSFHKNLLYLPDIIPKSTNPSVKVSLENVRNSNMPLLKPVEPVFKCLFDEPYGGPYWYDIYWYINMDTVKVIQSQLHNSNQSWLYPNDWVDNYDLNMVVSCKITCFK